MARAVAAVATAAAHADADDDDVDVDVDAGANAGVDEDAAAARLSGSACSPPYPWSCNETKAGVDFRCVCVSVCKPVCACVCERECMSVQHLRQAAAWRVRSIIFGLQLIAAQAANGRHGQRCGMQHA